MDLLLRGLVLLFFVTWSTRVEGYEFVEEPSSVNVTQGGTVSFRCKVAEVPEDQYWRVNRKSTNHNDNFDRGIETESTADELTYIATVPAIPSNDNITVQCVLLTPTQSISSQEARLRIQGLLGTVSDIKTEQINISSIIVSFHAPPSLIGVPVDHYSITISSPDSTMNHSLTTHSTTEILHLKWTCIKHWITISAWNDVGQGDPSTFSVVLTAPPGRPTVVVDQKYATNTQMETTLMATNDLACLGAAPESFVIEIYAESALVLTTGQCSFTNTSKISCGMPFSHSQDVHFLTLVLNLSEYLQLNHIYLGRIEMRNSAGMASISIELYTFDVSNATIVKYKDSYCVICEFVEGSRCQGCKIDILEVNTATSVATLAVPRFNDASSVTQCLSTLQLPSGEYYVLVSDIESDGSYSDTAKMLTFSMYNSEQSATSIATPTPSAIHEPLSFSGTALSLIVVFGAVCVLTLVVIVVLISCLLHSRRKKEQNSGRVQQNLQLRVTQPEPTYENAHEIILVESANKIKTEQCVAYASVTRRQ